MLDQHAETLVKSLIEHITGYPDYDEQPGEDLAHTPKRVIRMYKEVFSGYKEKAGDVLGTTFPNAYYDENDRYKSGMVIVKDIEFFSHCSHHMVPFIGSCHIAYIPKERVIGISKFARLVNMFARRLQIQENLTTQIADAINDHLKPLGVMVIMEAEHLCMRMRGVRNPTAKTVTSVVRGVFATETETRAEAMNLIHQR